MLTPEQRHKHSGLSGDGEKIRYDSLEFQPLAYCHRHGNPFNTSGGDRTNDGRMLSNASGVTIQKEAYYEIDAAVDNSTSGGTYTQTSIKINWTVVKTAYVESPYGISRSSIPMRYVATLKPGDLVTLYASAWTVNNTTETFLEVRERR